MMHKITSEQQVTFFSLFHPIYTENQYIYIAYQMQLLNCPIPLTIEQTAKNQTLNKNLECNQDQSIIVRNLLGQLLKLLSINDNLDDSQHPYKLRLNNSTISFSHSVQSKQIHDIKNKQSLLSSKSIFAASINIDQYQRNDTLHIGIDVETKVVPWKICKRFFNKNELILLESLMEKNKINKELKQLICKILWQAKECLIKIQQTSLAVGMRLDLSTLITEFIKKRYDNEFYIPIELEKGIHKRKKQTHIIYINQALNMVIIFTSTAV